MEHRGIKYTTWADRNMSGPPMFRYCVRVAPFAQSGEWYKSEPFVTESAAARAAMEYIDRNADSIHAAFNPPPRRRRRPVHNEKVIDGLREIIALASVELENGSEGAFSARQGGSEDAERNVEDAITYLRRLCRWAEQESGR